MFLLSSVIGLIVAMTALAGGGLSPARQPFEPIKILSNTHSIDFPEQVVFRLEAEAEAEITEVSLYYRLGSQRVRVYGYPRFVPSTRVSTEFNLKTDGAQYIPSGVDIEFHYLIKDADGNTVETEPRYMEFKDPSFNWQRYSQGDLTTLWHDRSRERVTAVVDGVAPRLREIRELLGLEGTRSMKAVIFNNSSEAGRSFPIVSETASSGHVYGGFAFGDLDVFVLVGLSSDGIVHEMTHLLVDEALDSPLARIPAWLNEGLSMFYESDNRSREATVSRAVHQGNLLPLRSMGNVPGTPDDIRLFYAQAQSLVLHMIDSHGRGAMSSLLDNINRGSRIEEALLAAYGMTLVELEREWRTGLSGDVQFAPLVDPGTFGTSVIITVAVAITAIGVAIRWLRSAALEPPDEEDNYIDL